MHRRALAVAALITAFSLPVGAQEREIVRFEGGAESAVVEASATGDGYRDYVLVSVTEGQALRVSLVTDGSASFNVLPLGFPGEAIYDGSIAGDDATGVILPVSGDYVIRVYLTGADEDEARTVPFALSISIT